MYFNGQSSAKLQLAFPVRAMTLPHVSSAHWCKNQTNALETCMLSELKLKHTLHAWRNTEVSRFRLPGQMSYSFFWEQLPVQTIETAEEQNYKSSYF